MEITLDNWLASPEKDYATGLAFYTAHGRNGALLRTFQMNRRPEYCREKLEYELRKIAAENEDVPPIAVAPTPPATEPAPKTVQNPGVIAAKDLIVERNKLSNTLHDFEDGDRAGRYPIVQQIKGLNQKIYATMNNLDLIEPTAKTKPEATAPGNILDVLREIQNLRTNQTKWKKKLAVANPGTPFHEKAKTKLAFLERNLAELNAQVVAEKAKVNVE